MIRQMRPNITLDVHCLPRFPSASLQFKSRPYRRDTTDITEQITCPLRQSVCLLSRCNEQIIQSADGIYSWRLVHENGYIHCISYLL